MTYLCGLKALNYDQMNKINPEEILKAHGLKNTRQRQIVLEELSLVDSAVSQPILEKKLSNDMDRVTLYRILNSFQENGILHSVMDQNGTTNYAVCGSGCTSGHHHDEHLHFNCTNCQKIYCLDYQTPVINLPVGYQANIITTMVYGTCKKCNSKKKSNMTS